MSFRKRWKGLTTGTDRALLLFASYVIWSFQALHAQALAQAQEEAERTAKKIFLADKGRVSENFVLLERQSNGDKPKESDQKNVQVRSLSSAARCVCVASHFSSVCTCQPGVRCVVTLSTHTVQGENQPFSWRAPIMILHALVLVSLCAVLTC